MTGPLLPQAAILLGPRRGLQQTSRRRVTRAGGWAVDLAAQTSHVGDVSDWKVTDEALHELIEDTVLGWLLDERRGEVAELWVEMNEDPPDDP